MCAHNFWGSLAVKEITSKVELLEKLLFVLAWNFSLHWIEIIGSPNQITSDARSSDLSNNLLSYELVKYDMCDA